MNTGRILWLSGLVSITLCAACSSRQPSQQEKTDTAVTGQRMVGELERLGKNGQDFIVLGVDAPGFDQLTLNQKKLAYYLYRAAIAGHTILDQQNHRYALEIRNLLEAIYLHSEGLDPQIKAAVHDYLKYIWINHGPYDHDSHVKTLPNDLTFPMLQQAAEHAQTVAQHTVDGRGCE